MINVYVDVDGVLNGVYAQAGQGGWNPSCLRREQINGFRITWHTDMINRLHNLLDQPHVHPVWLTTWEDDAPRLIAPALCIGFDWPVLHPTQTTFGKQREVFDDVEDTQPDKVLWLDDDAAYSRDYFTGNFKRISPYTGTGLTPDHLTEIEEFLRV